MKNYVYVIEFRTKESKKDWYKAVFHKEVLEHFKRDVPAVEYRYAKYVREE